MRQFPFANRAMMIEILVALIAKQKRAADETYQTLHHAGMDLYGQSTSAGAEPSFASRVTMRGSRSKTGSTISSGVLAGTWYDILYIDRGSAEAQVCDGGFGRLRRLAMDDTTLMFSHLRQLNRRWIFYDILAPRGVGHVTMVLASRVSNNVESIG
nr:hypothetical protein CFP56_21711 [Quercus suber]